jgi:hypothetical protein
MVRVGVNKAADQFVRAEAVLPEGEMAWNRLDDAPIARGSRERQLPRRRRVGTFEELRMAEAELDRRLEDSFQRFSRSEITAEEMAKERDELIRAYNRRVMAENIRYRGMLRQRR